MLTVVVLAACGLIYWQWLTGHAYYFLEVVYSIKMSSQCFVTKMLLFQLWLQESLPRGFTEIDFSLDSQMVYVLVRINEHIVYCSLGNSLCFSSKLLEVDAHQVYYYVSMKFKDLYVSLSSHRLWQHSCLRVANHCSHFQH